MARGMVVNEPIVSQAQTKAYDEGYDRVFGKDRKPIRGRWVWDEDAGRLVSASEYRERRAVDAPILAGRFYENAVATDGTDIGSRAKHAAYMRQHGVAMASDFKECGAKARAERERFARGEQDDKPYIEAVERSIYELEQKRRR